MTKLLLPLLFGCVMLAIGTACVSMPRKVHSLGMAATKGKRLYSSWISETQAVSSIRAGGYIAILMGLFLLWVLWRHA